MNEATLAVFGYPGWTELAVVAVVGLLVFGRRLPDIARSMGKSIVEFKRGLRDVQEDIEVQSRIDAKAPPKLENHTDAANPTTRGAESSQESSTVPK